MGVDASIPLQVQPLKVPDPLQSYGRLVTIQNAQAQNRLADLQGQAAQNTLNENAAYKAVFSDPSNFDAKGNLTPSALSQLYGAAPTQAMAYGKNLRDIKVADSTIDKNTAQAAASKQTTQLNLQKAQIHNAYNGTLLAQSGDLNGALKVMNQNLPPEQQATKLESITDDNGKVIGFRAYLPGGVPPHETLFAQALPVLRQQLLSPDTVYQAENQANIAKDRNATSLEQARITAGGRIGAAEVSANKPHPVDTPAGLVNVAPNGTATPVTMDGQPVMGNKSAAKPLPSNQSKDLGNLGDRANQINRIVSNFQPQYGGHTILGGAVTTMGKAFGDDTGQTQFWQDYHDYISQVRHDRLGGALTTQELATFNKYAIDERTDPKQAAANLARQQQIVNGALQRRANAAAAAGYNADEIEQLTGFRPTVGSTTAQQRIVNFNGKNMTAKRAPDGNYYVQMGDKFYRVDH